MPVVPDSYTAKELFEKLQAVEWAGTTYELPVWLYEAVLEHLTSCRGPSQQGWISVNDRLPTEENETCVIGSDGVAWAVLPWKLDTTGKGAGWMDLMEGVLYGPKDVTHWMPVPDWPSATREEG